MAQKKQDLERIAASPDFIPFQLAKLVKVAPSGTGWIHEIKFDGYRIQLRKAGMSNFSMVEKEEDVGGTWLVNTYPGCACDVQSHMYSFSFEPNADWSREFSPQPEILAYLRRCADKYQLRPQVRRGAANCQVAVG